MKRMLLSVLFAVLVLSGVVHSGTRHDYQIVDIYICDRSVSMAEMLAKTTVSRKELYTVSYCQCQGVNPEMRSEVKRVSCDAPRNLVYTCSCIGKNSY